jgi:hypothetical protein
MKTYKQHLITIKSFGEKLDPIKKPTFRSSAIFPVINNKFLETNIMFLGYWLIKRKILEVTVLITLRNQKGVIIKRESMIIDKIKSYKISIRKMINSRNTNFVGSLELEVFSTRDMVFPYPAFVINYLSKKSSTFVHTCGRVYNDFEDLKLNSDIQVPEAGFDVIPNDNFLPFFAFVNGPIPILKKIIDIEVINSKGKILKKKITIKQINALETKFIYFLTQNEKIFLEGQKGTIKIKHNLEGFFPRFLCGNIKNDKSISSLTHTYYDTSKSTKNSHWLNPDKEKLYDSIITFPIFYKKKEYTELVLYPIYPESNMTFDLEIYDTEGKCLDKIYSLFNINKKLKLPTFIKIKNFLNKDILNRKQNLFAKILINGKGKLPSRIKFGLNIGKPNKFDVPSNICFNAQVPNVKIFKKPGTFKWCPILNNKNSSIILANFSYARTGFKKSIVKIKFWRERDQKFLKKTIVINDNGSYYLEINKNKKIKSFFGKETCWATFESDNPFLNGYYLEDMGSGIVGADHLF